MGAINPRTRYVELIAGDGVVWKTDYQDGYEQSQPQDRHLVLPYRREVYDLKGYDTNGGADTTVGLGAGSLFHRFDEEGYEVQASNRAYEKLKSKIESAEIGTNLAEYRQVNSMLGTRGKEVLGLLSLLARGKFITAGRAIGGTFYKGKPPKKGKSKWILPDYPKKTNISLSNLWLEWHFGASPLISDVQAAMKVLTDPIPPARIYGSSEFFGRSVWEVQDPANPGFDLRKFATRYRCRQGASVSVTNPNLAMAGQLGLLNPAAILWEIVPFSFVLDWFVNVGDCLQSFSDFAGMQLDSTFTSKQIWTEYDHTRSRLNGAGVPVTTFLRGKRLTFVRVYGLTTPQLSFRPLKLPGLARSATIWSLVSQIAQRHR